jgi:hypothetical protein
LENPKAHRYFFRHSREGGNPESAFFAVILSAAKDLLLPLTLYTTTADSSSLRSSE